jgi:cytoskeleton protein RodZ
LATFGERLKRTRENKKMSLEDVARATKISTRMITALEEEKFDQLPGGVFNKGFVRAYARHLELNEEQALRDYTSAAGLAATEIKSEDAELRAIAERKEKERAGRPRSQGVPWGIVAACLLVLALGLSIWGFFTRERIAGNPSRSALRSGSIPAESVADTVPDSSSPQVQPQPVARRETVSDATDTSSSDSASQAVLSAPIALVIRAREDSWLSITVDGRSFYQDTLAAGQEQSISAQNEVVVKSGNIGGLEISFNGNQLPMQGSEAEVKTLTFVPSGLKQADQ